MYFILIKKLTYTAMLDINIIYFPRISFIDFYEFYCESFHLKITVKIL